MFQKSRRLKSLSLFISQITNWKICYQKYNHNPSLTKIINNLKAKIVQLIRPIKKYRMIQKSRRLKIFSLFISQRMNWKICYPIRNHNLSLTKIIKNLKTKVVQLIRSIRKYRMIQKSRRLKSFSLSISQITNWKICYQKFNHNPSLTKIILKTQLLKNLNLNKMLSQMSQLSQLRKKRKIT